jgi:hypothetical protein
VYNGKALSEWLIELEKGPSLEDIQAEMRGATNTGSEATEQTRQKIENRNRDAILQIGTNGIATLLDIVGVGEGNRKQVLSKLKSKEFQEAARRKDVPLETVRGMAVDGFAILGTNAEPAIPQLTRLLRQDPECRLEVAFALTQIGPKGFAVLTNAINDEDLAGALVFAIGQKGGGDLQAVTRLLIAALKSPNPTTRGNAAQFLAGKDATLAVPALIPMLDDAEQYAWQAAAISLGGFGPAAKSAVPKLLSIYTNQPDVFVMGALKGIDREAAGQAEAFLVNSGPLNSARYGYTRTLLPNGKELIAGGYIHTEIPTVSNRYLSSAELFDPKTGKWTNTGEMNVARYGHAAILLPIGKVLVAGGSDSKGHALSNAELYDPATGKWTETGSLNAAHLAPGAVLQPNGKVLIFSGYGNLNSPAFDKELYDPATGTWKMISEEPAFDKALYDEATRTWKFPPRHKAYE